MEQGKKVGRKGVELSSNMLVALNYSLLNPCSHLINCFFTFCLQCLPYSFTNQKPRDQHTVSTTVRGLYNTMCSDLPICH